ncbi:probable sodium/metabolite cotransporter BASS1, chloroplastic [Tanacetum coccineum]
MLASEHVREIIRAVWAGRNILGFALNEVTLIAQGDVPLLIVMTVCNTLGAVLLTPLLTMVLAGSYVHVDALKLSNSTLQVVVAPVLLGSYLQSTFPRALKTALPFAPLLAVLTSSLLACSVFSENVGRLKSSMALTSLAPDATPLLYAQTFLSSEWEWLCFRIVMEEITTRDKSGNIVLYGQRTLSYVEQGVGLALSSKSMDHAYIKSLKLMNYR